MWAYTSHTHHTHITQTHLPFVYTQIVLDGSAKSSTQLCVFTLAPLQSSIGPSSVCKASSYSSYYSSFKLINSQKDCSFWRKGRGRWAYPNQLWWQYCTFKSSHARLLKSKYSCWEYIFCGDFVCIYKNMQAFHKIICFLSSTRIYSQIKLITLLIRWFLQPNHKLIML